MSPDEMAEKGSDLVEGSGFAEKGSDLVEGSGLADGSDLVEGSALADGSDLHDDGSVVVDSALANDDSIVVDSDESDEVKLELDELEDDDKNLLQIEEPPKEFDHEIMHDVFISYSSDDKDIANEIKYVLENNGLKCWIAPRNISSGKNYLNEIADAIKSTKIVVLVFSESSQNSKYVINEVIMAFTYKKDIISFHIDDAKPNSIMEYYLKVAQWMYADSDYKDKLGNLSEDARELCKKEKIEINPSLDGFIPEDLSNQKSNRLSLVLLATPFYWLSFIYMGNISKKELWTAMGFLYMIPFAAILILLFEVFTSLFLVYPLFNLVNVLFLIFWALAIIHGYLIRNEFLTRHSVLKHMALDKGLFDYLYKMYYDL